MSVLGKHRQDHVLLGQGLGKGCWAWKVGDLSCPWFACDHGHTTASWAPVSPLCNSYLSSRQPQDVLVSATDNLLGISSAQSSPMSWPVQPTV